MTKIGPSTPGLMWPALTRECRPWTRWWWFGSAVDEAEISRHLQLLQQAGFGGVEISPIYGVHGAEKRAIPFLSATWIRMLRAALREAGQRDLGVDLLTGTGWPFGGPSVPVEDSASKVLFESYEASEGEPIEATIGSKVEPDAVLQAVMAYSEGGDAVDLFAEVNLELPLKWKAPPGHWKVYSLFQTRTNQQVKRAAPGGEGLVVDHFSRPALQRYLDAFDRLFATLSAGEQPRCVFNDSYEVYEANWTAELLPQFQARRGYDLRHYLPALRGDAEPEAMARVRSDYRQTIAELLHEAMADGWATWAREHGAQARYQAHGSPGNLLDLYAAADIPETETFGADWLRLAGRGSSLDDPPASVDRADVLVGKLASSAAHVAGRRLCSSETFTWLGEHGQASLDDMKAVVDVSFVMGVNHVFYHGTPFSPAEADWPGWMFYATTHVAPTNPFWRDLPALNAYISRCQSFLQAGLPDNDLLLYLPIFDLWRTEGGAEHLLHFLSVHSQHWLGTNLPAFRAAADLLWDRGYSFDFVSDQLLEWATEVAGSKLRTRGGSYRALVVAGCAVMLVETLQRIIELARAGGLVLIVGDLPRDVPGMGDLAVRRQQLRAALASLEFPGSSTEGVSEVKVGAGRILVGPELEPLLQTARVPRESLVGTGLKGIRRRDEHGYLYFLANLGRQKVDQWISLPVKAAAIAIDDPLNNRRGLATIRPDGDETRVYLQLDPGGSRLLRVYSQPAEAPSWDYLSAAGESHAMKGKWRIEFIEGGPTLPEARIVDCLVSWTELPDDSGALAAFSGTARYTTTFAKLASEAQCWSLDVGEVYDSARVKLNGEELGTLYTRPFRILAPTDLLQDENRLEIEVTNLMANRLADLDRRRVPWRRFFFVNAHYEPFDASDWQPLPSGLLGPVRLTPLRRLDPGHR